MKQGVGIVVFWTAFSACGGYADHGIPLGNYYDPKGLVDKTEELVKLNTGWIQLENLNTVDGYTRIGDSIFGGEIACNIEPLEGVDVSSFEVLPGSEYARDKNNLYYPLEILCVDYADCGVCYYSQFTVEDVSPSRFRYLGNEYATDDQGAFFRGERIPGADGGTFKVIEGPEFFYFATDKTNVYRHDQIFHEADPKSFYYDKDDERSISDPFGHTIIIGDKEHEWHYSPPATFTEIERR